MPPIKPSEVKRIIPEVVFDCFNQLINERFISGEAVIRQADVVALLKSKGFDHDDVYKKGWLDVEDAYRAAGWKVDYEKPGFNEAGEAYFTFSKKKAKAAHGK